MVDEKTNFVDAEAYGGSGSGNASLTFPIIVLLQVQKCSSLGSFDLKSGGYWGVKYSPDPRGGLLEHHDYLESRALSYMQAVFTLYDLLDGYSGGELKSAFDNYSSTVEKELDEGLKRYADKVNSAQLKSYYQDDCVIRARCARVLFRACVSWLRKNNYLQHDSVEEGLEE